MTGLIEQAIRHVVEVHEAVEVEIVDPVTGEAAIKISGDPFPASSQISIGKA